jgi:serine/threonine protein kinase
MAHDAPTATGLRFGQYDVLSKVGEGGAGAVYKARHRDTGDVVALKVLPPHMAANPVVLRRFAKEFRATRLLDHPNIVRALDFGAAGTPYLVMEFVEGISLGERLQNEGPLPEAEAVRLIAQVAEGLAQAHRQGLIHRDVKPDNILVTPDGQAKLIDLGLVKDDDTDTNLTRTGRGLGTPHFMAPEQFRGAKNVDQRGDIYSLGATLYQLVTGRLPFDAVGGPVEALSKKILNDLTPPRLLVPTLSEQVERAILRSMNASRERRPATCQAFLDDLLGRTKDPVELPSDVWHLTYRDGDGRERTAAGSTAQLRKWFTDGRMRGVREVRASRSEEGPFLPLGAIEGLRDLIARSPTPPPPSVAPVKAAPQEQQAIGILELLTIFVVTLAAVFAVCNLLLR